MNPATIAHVGITTSDLDRAVEWYCRIFEFEEVRRFRKESLDVTGAALRRNGSFLEILQPGSPAAAPAAAGEGLPSRLARLGVNHIALAVGNCEECFENLQAAGVTMVSELMDKKMFFCTDPDGTLLEVRQQS